MANSRLRGFALGRGAVWFEGFADERGEVGGGAAPFKATKKLRVSKSTPQAGNILEGSRVLGKRFKSPA